MTEDTTIISLDAERLRREQAQAHQEAITRATARLLRMIKEAQEHPLGMIKLLVRDPSGDLPAIYPLHTQFSQAVLDHPCVLLECPRGSSKTTTALAVLTWFICRNSNLRCKIISSNDDYAQHRVGVVRKWLDESELLHKAFPHIHVDRDHSDTKMEFTLTRGLNSPDPTVSARGVLSSGTGARADLILFDDAADFRNTILNPSLRTQVIDKVRNDWLPTLATGGRIWSVFTPWHKQDVNAYFKENARSWHYIRLPHGTPDDPYHSSCPLITPSSKLREQRETLGPLAYARSYLLRIEDTESQLIHSHMIQPYSQSLLDPVLDHCLCYISIDPAKGQITRRSRSSDPDAHGVSVGLVPPQVADESKFRLFVPEAFETRCSTTLLIALIQQLIATYQPIEALLVESQGLTQLVEWLGTIPNLPPVIPIPATVNKAIRVQGTTPLYDAGDPDSPKLPRILFHPSIAQTTYPIPQIFIPTDQGEVPARRTFRDQALSFPATSHDDVLDSVTQLCTWVMQQHMPKVTPPGRVKVESFILDL